MKILAIAAVAASIVLFNLGIQLAKDGCLDAGGRIVEAGLDRMCEFGDGRTMAMTISPATPLAWVLAGVLWIALVLGLNWGMSRFVRRGGPGGHARAKTGQ